jgi:hypothetical protein
MKKTEKTEKKKQPKAKKFNAADHWKGMPEFKQENIKPFHTIKINFSDKESMHKLSKIINQPINSTTRSLWYPKEEWDLYNDKRYSDKK